MDSQIPTWKLPFFLGLILSAICQGAIAQDAKAVPGSTPLGQYVLRYDLPEKGFKSNWLLPPGGPNDICRAYTANLNEYHNLDFGTCNARLSVNFPRFSRPAWQKIPLDLIQAKAIFDFNNGWWEGWLKWSKPARTKGEVKMWRLKIDLIDDGKRETLVRLSHAFWTEKRKADCRYTDSYQMLVDASHPEEAYQYMKRSRLDHVLGNDLIYDSRTRRYYLLQWEQMGPAEAEGQESFVLDSPDGSMPHKGAKAGVVVYLPTATRAIPICWIDWVPTGHGR